MVCLVTRDMARSSTDMAPNSNKVDVVLEVQFLSELSLTLSNSEALQIQT